MYIKHNISFFLNKQKGKPYAPLRCRIRWGKNSTSVNIGFSVTVDYWDQATQQCARRSTHGKNDVPATIINRAIADAEELIHSIFAEFEAQEIVPTEEELKHTIDVRTGKILCDNTIFPYYDEFLAHGSTWRVGTLKKLRTIKRHLQEFSPSLRFEDFDRGMADRLIAFYAKRGFSNTTITKNINSVKWFIRWAIYQEYTEDFKFNGTRIKLPHANNQIIFLSWDELMTMYNHDFSATPSLECVRDVFCFCCFTSLRFSDVSNLKRANITDTYINITTIKTNDTIRIDLNDYSKAILQKYQSFNFPNGKALPVISGQKTNVHLKRVAKMCGLDKPIEVTTYHGSKRVSVIHPKYELITTHAGRRTFICNALMLGIPPDIVMKWTGHSDYKAMKPYIDITDEAKQNAMNLFNKK